MAPTLTFPGVYIQEVPSGVRPIAGVSTGTALFIGAAGQGRLDDPTLVLSHAEYVEGFGDDATVSDMSRQVRLFFLNGGSTAYVLRIANGATSADVTLDDEAGAPALTLTASSPGASGEAIRARVSFTPANPDSTFDLELFRWDYGVGGTRTAVQLETFTGLSMDPSSSRYAPDLLTQQSQHVDATAAGGAGGNGSSQSGLAVPWRTSAPSTLRTQWAALIGTAGPPAAEQTFTISVDSGDPVVVDLSAINVGAMTAGTFEADLGAAVAQAIQDAHALVGRPGVTVDVTLPAGPVITAGDAALHGDATFDVTAYLLLTSTTGGNIAVLADGGTLARRLRLGLANGGREVGSHAALRPAPNAALLDDASLDALGALAHGDVTNLTLDGEVVVIPASTDPARPFFVPLAGGYATDLRGGLDGLAERLRVVRDAVNAHAAATPSFQWAAELWGSRLALRRTGGDDNALIPADFATGGTDIAGFFSDNTRLMTVGVAGLSLGSQTNPAAVATDGAAPQGSDYARAYTIAEREIDIFNLLVLPETNNGGVDRLTLWGPASVFCLDNRAFLLIDPPPTWTDHTTPIDGTGANDSITDLRTGLVKDYSAVHFPNLIIDEDGLRVITSPSGAIAGLMARTDETRGVWKAAAGTEADLRGIVGVQYAFSDGENGNLNPHGVNTIRRFPIGIVNWGARTMAGDDVEGSEYKYVPVRRLLLYLEESIYRGLQWTVFEPNGIDLWAAIRLNVGNFLSGLFRRGAFAGATASQAFYVKCDAETTTPTERALGIVNVHVGVATLKPAEFVVISFRQITLPEE